MHDSMTVYVVQKLRSTNVDALKLRFYQSGYIVLRTYLCFEFVGVLFAVDAFSRTARWQQTPILLLLPI